MHFLCRHRRSRIPRWRPGSGARRLSNSPGRARPSVLPAFPASAVSWLAVCTGCLPNPPIFAHGSLPSRIAGESGLHLLRRSLACVRCCVLGGSVVPSVARNRISTSAASSVLLLCSLLVRSSHDTPTAAHSFSRQRDPGGSAPDRACAPPPSKCVPDSSPQCRTSVRFVVRPVAAEARGATLLNDHRQPVHQCRRPPRPRPLPGSGGPGGARRCCPRRGHRVPLLLVRLHATERRPLPPPPPPVPAAAAAPPFRPLPEVSPTHTGKTGFDRVSGLFRAGRTGPHRALHSCWCVTTENGM